MANACLHRMHFIVWCFAHPSATWLRIDSRNVASRDGTLQFRQYAKILREREPTNNHKKIYGTNWTWAIFFDCFARVAKHTLGVMWGCHDLQLHTEAHRQTRWMCVTVYERVWFTFGKISNGFPGNVSKFSVILELRDYVNNANWLRLARNSSASRFLTSCFNVRRSYAKCDIRSRHCKSISTACLSLIPTVASMAQIQIEICYSHHVRGKYPKLGSSKHTHNWLVVTTVCIIIRCTQHAVANNATASDCITRNVVLLEMETRIRYSHGLLVVIGGVCATVVTISLRTFHEDDATDSECPASVSSSDRMVAVDAIDDPFDGTMAMASSSPPAAVAAPAPAPAAAIVCVSFIACVTLEMCLRTFALASVPVSGLTLSFVIISNAFDTFIVASSMTFELLVLLWLLWLMAFVMSLIVSAPADNGMKKRKPKSQFITFIRPRIKVRTIRKTLHEKLRIEQKREGI